MTFSVFLDIFYPPIFRCFDETGVFQHPRLFSTVIMGPMKISPNEAFLILQKWQVEPRPVMLVGSLMPSHTLRGLVTPPKRLGVHNAITALVSERSALPAALR
jgi:hypothetical protein